MNKKTRIITLFVLAIMIVMCVSLGITKAFMKPVEDTSSVTEVSLSSCAKISLTDKGSINLSNTYPMSKNRALNTTPYSFTVTSSCDGFVGFNLYIATFNTNTLDASKIHYIITEVGSKDIISEGLVGEATDVTSSFTDQEKTEYNVGMKGNVGTIYQLYNANIPLKGSKSYDLYLYVDEDATNVTAGQTFNAGIAVKSYDREMGPYHEECSDDSLACAIAKKYTTQGSNNLYYHNGTILATEENTTTGVKVGDVIDANDGSYRYTGSSETTNNWVCFGTGDATKTYAAGWCDDEHLYRIIGVFNSVIVDDTGNATTETEQRVKLMKAYEGTESSLGTAQQSTATKSSTYYKGKLMSSPGYYWSGLSSNQSNVWTNSTLNTGILNGTYLTTLGEPWTNRIATTEWKIAGTHIYDVPSKTYQNEIANQDQVADGNKVYNAKIGLMYISDYGFAASLDNWSTNLMEYDNDTTRNNNWLFLGLFEWVISSNRIGSSNSAYFIRDNGNLDSGAVQYANKVVRPTFYLNSDVKFSGGSGTETDPYRIA